MSGRDISIRELRKKSVSTMGRRRFMETLASAGFGGMSLLGLTPEAVEGAARDQVPIVYGHSSQGETNDTTLQSQAASGDGPEYRRKYVPLDWYEEYQRAQAAAEKLEQRLENHIKKGNNPAIKGVWVSPGKYGGRSAKITLDVLAHRRRSLTIPESIDSIPIDVNETEKTKKGSQSATNRKISSSSQSQRDYSDSDDGSDGFTIQSTIEVKGGSSVNYNGETGTLCSVYDTRFESAYFATSWHLDDGVEYGDSLHKINDKIAEVTFSECLHDIAVGTPTDPYVPVFKIDDAETEAVTGQFSNLGVSDLIAQDKKARKMGNATGYTEGKIHSVGNAYDYTLSCNSRQDQVKWGDGDDRSGGDSGAPTYRPDPNSTENGMWMIAIHTGVEYNYTTSDRATGTAAYAITDEWDYLFYEP